MIIFMSTYVVLKDRVERYLTGQFVHWPALELVSMGWNWKQTRVQINGHQSNSRRPSTKTRGPETEYSSIFSAKSQCIVIDDHRRKAEWGICEKQPPRSFYKFLFFVSWVNEWSVVKKVGLYIYLYTYLYLYILLIIYILFFSTLLLCLRGCNLIVKT